MRGKFFLNCLVVCGLIGTGLSPASASENRFSAHLAEDGSFTDPLDTFLNVSPDDYGGEALLVKGQHLSSFSGVLLQSLGLSRIEPLGPNALWGKAYLNSGVSCSDEIQKLRKSGLFECVDFDYEQQGSAESVGSANPLFASQTYLEQTKIPEAWDYLSKNGAQPGGSSSVTVAVIDTGVDMSHPDLVNNLWTNSREIPGNGIDDDGNGYIDDVHGWNFVAEDTAGAQNPSDDNGHGTHVAGIISAANNTIGGIGIAFNTKIMVLKAGNSSGYFLDSDVSEAIRYAYMNGADVINMSFGGSTVALAVQDALKEAYPFATLVAAAGNSGQGNEADPVYPAAFPYVLGVMSVNASNAPSIWTNYDQIPDNNLEYEIYAPGEAVLSTAPNGKYASLSGTSMAAPIVSGVAALLRSLHLDKETYPTKRVMAQIVETSSTHVLKDSSQNLFFTDDNHLVVNALDALGDIPKPSLSLFHYSSWDGTSLSLSNNGNGVLESGETIGLAVELGNKGGLASQIHASIDVQRSGSAVDPYLSVSGASVDYPDLGTYSQEDNGMTSDSSGNVTGIAHPFLLTVSKDCPNDYLCEVHLTLTWKNGLDGADETVYSTTDSLSVRIRHGSVLPALISTDTTLEEGRLYILAKNLVIEKGVTLTLAPGTHLQYFSDSTSYYQDDTSIYRSAFPRIINNGSFVAVGTEEKPIVVDAAAAYSLSVATILENRKGSTSKIIYCDWTNFSETRSIYSDRIAIDEISHSKLTYSYDLSLCEFDAVFSATIFTDNLIRGIVPHLSLSFVTCDRNCFAIYCHRDEGASVAGYSYGINVSTSFEDNVVYACAPLPTTAPSYGSSDTKYLSPVFCFNYYDDGKTFSNTPGIIENGCSQCNVARNAYLGTPTQPELIAWSHWQAPGPFYTDSGSKATSFALKETYWQETSPAIVSSVLSDYYDDGGSLPFDTTTSPYVEGTSDLSALWPFVKNVSYEDSQGNAVTAASSGIFKLIIDFNRAMDTSESLSVAFGSSTPFNDHLVSGAYESATRWVGSYDVKTTLGNGTQYLTIRDGQTSDGSKALLPDSGRFSFTVDITSAMAMSLSAIDSEQGSVNLHWAQDDYATLMGYNLYRSETQNGNYVRINPTLIPSGTSDYVDSEVEPGKTYFYSFTVVLTDFSESKPSGRTSVTLKDIVSPRLIHTPVNQGYLGYDLVISCLACDNIAVTSATLYYRAKGASTYSSLPMVVVNSKYSAKIPSSALTLAGIEYYIEISDGVNFTRKGSADVPFAITILDGSTLSAKGDVNGDGEITAADVQLVLRHLSGAIILKDEQFKRADLNNDGTLSAAEALTILQYVNGKISSLGAGA